ncbi:MAG: pilus (MSHA type) biogenesis protein MshL [Chromatiales bacterium]
MSIRGIVALTGLASLLACSALVPPPPVPSAGHLRPENNRQTQDIPPVVDKVPLLPRPEPAPDLEKYTVVVNEVPVKELLFALARDAQVNVDIDPGIEGIVTLNAIDQTLPQILDRIARQADVRFEIQGKNIIVSPDRPYLRTYRVDYLNLTRESQGTIDIATQIATTGMSDIGGGGGGGGNNSTASITDTANNRFWLTLTRNIQALVGETAAGGAAGQGDLPVTDSVIPNPESGIISVRATSKQHAAVQALLDKVLANAQRQVLVEATVVEVTLNDQYQQGIDWRLIQNDGTGFQFSQDLLGAAATALAPGATQIPDLFRNAFILNYIDDDTGGKDINVVVKLLRNFGDIKVLSSPKIMALNNQTAVLKVVENVVYFEVTVEPVVILTGGAGVEQQPNVSTTAKTVPVGLVMTVTPQINENDAVTLNVRPTISRVSQFVPDPNPELGAIRNNVPQIQVQEMESVLQINNGQIAVLGGLMQDTVRQDSNSIPLLSDIPLLGDSLFRSRDNEYEKAELVIFLRPLVIRNPSLEGDLGGYRQYLEERVESNIIY